MNMRCSDLLCQRKLVECRQKVFNKVDILPAFTLCKQRMEYSVETNTHVGDYHQKRNQYSLYHTAPIEEYI